MCHKKRHILIKLVSYILIKSIKTFKIHVKCKKSVDVCERMKVPHKETHFNKKGFVYFDKSTKTLKMQGKCKKSVDVCERIIVPLKKTHFNKIGFVYFVKSTKTLKM